MIRQEAPTGYAKAAAELDWAAVKTDLKAFFKSSDESWPSGEAEGKNLVVSAVVGSHIGRTAGDRRRDTRLRARLPPKDR